MRADDAIQGEGQFVQDVLPLDRDSGGPGLFGFDPRLHLVEDSSIVNPATREALLSAWGPRWDGSRTWMLEKSPANLIRTRGLQALFPGSAFVVVIRHPLVAALATQRWSSVSIPTLVAHWVHCHRLLFEDLARIERFVVLQYERLVSEPQATYARVCEQLGLPPAPLGEEVRPRINARYQELFEGRGPALGYHTRPSSWLPRIRLAIARRMARFLWQRGFEVTSLSTELRHMRPRWEPVAEAMGYDFDDFERAGLPVLGPGDRATIEALAARLVPR
jgi:hypothetical protein